MGRYGCTRGCGRIIEQLIGKIFASDLREITSRLYEVGGYLALDKSRAIWREPNHDCNYTQPPKTPFDPSSIDAAAYLSEIEGVPPVYVYIHTPLPSAQFFNLDAFAKDCKRDEDFNTDLLSDEERSTGEYTMCWVIMQLTSILHTTVANWANQTVKIMSDWLKRECSVYYYTQLADILKYILKDIFICIIKGQCFDEGESIWRWYKGCWNTINDILRQNNW